MCQSTSRLAVNAPPFASELVSRQVAVMRKGVSTHEGNDALKTLQDTTRLVPLLRPPKRPTGVDSIYDELFRRGSCRMLRQSELAAIDSEFRSVQDTVLIGDLDVISVWETFFEHSSPPRTYHRLRLFQGGRSKYYRILAYPCEWEQVSAAYRDLFVGALIYPPSPHLMVRGRILREMAFFLSEVYWHRNSEEAR